MSRSSYPLVFERSKPGRKGYDLPALDVPAKENLIPAELLSDKKVKLPEIAEIDLVRHYTGLSQRNFGVDSGFYPLGSCTMKYNPKIDEEMAVKFDKLHPLADLDCAQGVIEMMTGLSESLCEIAGFDSFTLQPAAGAHGEYTGLTLIKAYHEERGDFDRKVIIVPDAAHGTNPASAAMCGFKIREIVSAPDGGVDLEALRAAMGPDVAGFMLTNPSTLGIFETNIKEVTKIVHEGGGLCYYDGANFNAIMGIVRPGDMGFDCMHTNLHKTFATPHGGGGPGAGGVGCTAALAPYLPYPVATRNAEGKAILDFDRPKSVGKVRSFYGSVSVLARAYAYILSLGASGLKEASENAVLNANYIFSNLKEDYGVPHDRICMHECVINPGKLEENGIHTTDIAKTLIDFGYHPPTIYFPLIVHEALMIEPTESESRETMDAFIGAMKEIARIGRENPEYLHTTPVTTPVGRPDEVKAARNPVIKCEW